MCIFIFQNSSCNPLLIHYLAPEFISSATPQHPFPIRLVHTQAHPSDDADTQSRLVASLQSIGVENSTPMVAEFSRSPAGTISNDMSFDVSRSPAASIDMSNISRSPSATNSRIHPDSCRASSASDAADSPLPYVSVPSAVSAQPAASMRSRKRRRACAEEHREGTLKADVYRDGKKFYYLIKESIDEDGIVTGVLLEFMRNGQRRISLKEYATDMVLQTVDWEGAPIIVENVISSSVQPFILPVHLSQIGQCFVIDAKCHYAVEQGLLREARFKNVSF